MELAGIGGAGTGSESSFFRLRTRRSPGFKRSTGDSPPCCVSVAVAHVAAVIDIVLVGKLDLQNPILALQIFGFGDDAPGRGQGKNPEGNSVPMRSAREFPLRPPRHSKSRIAAVAILLTLTSRIPSSTERESAHFCSLFNEGIILYHHRASGH